MSRSACAKKILCNAETAARANAITDLAKMGLLTEDEMEEFAAYDIDYIEKTDEELEKVMERLDRADE